MTRKEFKIVGHMNQFRAAFLPVIAILFLASCSSTVRKRPVDSSREAPDTTEDIDSQIRDFDEEVAAPDSTPIPSSVDTELESDSELEDLPAPKSPKKHGIPSTFNTKVADWIRYFSQKDRERFQRYLDRGEAYREVVENILEQNNVPADLYYLGLIESGFNFQAKSSAKAVGVWQFMRSTGKMYGLNVDSYEDERKDPIRATEAAAKHLRDLYREFGSWYLALSAYNAGTGRIRSAVRRGGTNDFWELVERKILPKETMEYVPKFLAARYIGEHPDLFAFYINEEKRYPDVALVRVPSPLKFSSIEQKCSIPAGTLTFVNPHYLRGYTHPAHESDEIWVPENNKAVVEKQFEALKAFRIKIKPEKIAKLKKVEKRKYHVVRAGETLKTIARSQGLSVAYLKRVNGLKSARLRVGQQLNLAATEYRQHRTHPRNQKRRKGR